MRTIDVFSELKAVLVLASVALSAVRTGPDIDRTAFDGGVFLVQLSGTTGTPTSYAHEVKLQSAPALADGTAGTYTDLKDAYGNAQKITLTAEGVYKLRFEGDTAGHFVRAVATPSFTGGTTPSATIAISGALAGSKYGPVA